jgi:hypothetical protein
LEKHILRFMFYALRPLEQAIAEALVACAH